MDVDPARVETNPDTQLANVSRTQHLAVRTNVSRGVLTRGTDTKTTGGGVSRRTTRLRQKNDEVIHSSDHRLYSKKM